MSRTGVAVIVAAFVALQATNTAVVSIMGLFVTETLGLDVVWAGIALGVAAGLEIPALLLIGRLSRRFSSLGLLASGCLAGIAYYAAMAYVTGPVLAARPAGAERLVLRRRRRRRPGAVPAAHPAPGLATGLYMNTRRLGAVVSGPIIAFGALTALGYRGPSSRSVPR